ncbi:MAG: ABC-F family ATP-binding cassette domain-containing protein [Parachlamydiales bacterium]
MIHLNEVCHSAGSRPLFENVSLSFHAGHRYAVTGPNGAGKSTLMKGMFGLFSFNGGSVRLPNKVGFLRQNIEDYRDCVVRDVVVMGNDRLWKALKERDELYEQEMTDEVGMRIGELEEIVADEDGYSAEANAEALLMGAGIEEAMFDQKMSSIPTDLQFRVLLCQALFGEPQALLLDEPTNHLDLSSIGWLEEFLLSYQGTLIVISHDRHFLNAVATDVADIDYETIILYPGNYDDMVMAKMAVRQRAEQEAKTKEKKIAQLREFVAKFGAGTRASQVKSRQKEMERLQPGDLKKSNIDRPYIRFMKVESPSGKIPLKVEGVWKGYDGNQVIKGFSFEVHRGDKIAVIGNNGQGKSTLLKLCAGVFAPDKGSVEPGHQVVMSYFPQDHDDVLGGMEEMTLFDWLKETRKGLYDQDVRGVLGRMLFGGDDAFKKIGVLSGGEKARMILARMMLSEHNLAIMDEPNNHLDLESVSALAWGLNDYKGTLIFAAHDRDLLESVATKIIAFEKGEIRFFDGPYEEYLKS